VPVIAGGVSLVVAVVGAVAAIAALGLYEVEVIGVDASTNLALAGMACSLVAIPVGVVGKRWAERRGESAVLGKAGWLLGAGTLAAWFALFVYALSRDTP